MLAPIYSRIIELNPHHIKAHGQTISMIVATQLGKIMEPYKRLEVYGIPINECSHTDFHELIFEDLHNHYLGSLYIDTRTRFPEGAEL